MRYIQTIQRDTELLDYKRLKKLIDKGKKRREIRRVFIGLARFDAGAF
jgi:hypothetical protein